MGRILSSAPLDLVDFLFDLEGFEVIEFGFVRLKFGVEFVLACFFLDVILAILPLEPQYPYRVQDLRFRFSQREPLFLPCHPLQGSCRYGQTPRLRLCPLCGHRSAIPFSFQNSNARVQGERSVRGAQATALLSSPRRPSQWCKANLP